MEPGEEQNSQSPSDGNQNYTILDICSGTGTIGIAAAKTICKTNTGAISVIGVELCQAAVLNARDNAALNDITSSKSAQPDKPDNVSADFICSRAEGILDMILTCRKRSSISPSILSVLDKNEVSLNHIKLCAADGRNILAVVDPPREGMHADCLRSIRACESITRLVYVSCNPTKSLVNDAEILCQPMSNKYRGTAFRPLKARPVDLFPFTPHCELVMIFERILPDTACPKLSTTASPAVLSNDEKSHDINQKEIPEAKRSSITNGGPQSDGEKN
jgi:tRNA (uracil-5-)-methyltransferase